MLFVKERIKEGEFRNIMIDYKKYINEVQDFPENGISFKDISPMLADRVIFKKVIDEMGNLVSPIWTDVPDYWVGIDARGFLFAGALSYEFGGGVIMCRKKGKLPPPTESYSYHQSHLPTNIQDYSHK